MFASFNSDMCFTMAGGGITGTRLTWPSKSSHFPGREEKRQAQKGTQAREVKKHVSHLFFREVPSKGHPQEHLEHDDGIICFFLQYLQVPHYLNCLLRTSLQKAPTLPPSGTSSYRPDKWILPIFCFILHLQLEKPLYQGQASLIGSY